MSPPVYLGVKYLLGFTTTCFSEFFEFLPLVLSLSDETADKARH